MIVTYTTGGKITVTNAKGKWDLHEGDRLRVVRTSMLGRSVIEGELYINRNPTYSQAYLSTDGTFSLFCEQDEITILSPSVDKLCDALEHMGGGE